MSAASAESCATVPSAWVRVVAIGDDGGFTLEDGREAMLDAIRLPRGVADRAPERFAAEARHTLTELTDDLEIGLAAAPDMRDRYGRVRAQVFGGKGGAVWVQRELLDQGLARVQTMAGQAGCAFELLAAERGARERGRGLWASRAYRVRTPEEAAADTGTFQLVEGLVTAHAENRGRVYLNFGPDWRTDFTVTIAPEDKRAFRRYPFAELVGRRVRVRGFVEFYNGPQIVVTHPEEIERLD